MGRSIGPVDPTVLDGLEPCISGPKRGTGYAWFAGYCSFDFASIGGPSASPERTGRTGIGSGSTSVWRAHIFSLDCVWVDADRDFGAAGSTRSAFGSLVSPQPCNPAAAASQPQPRSRCLVPPQPRTAAAPHSRSPALKYFTFFVRWQFIVLAG